MPRPGKKSQPDVDHDDHDDFGFGDGFGQPGLGDGFDDYDDYEDPDVVKNPLEELNLPSKYIGNLQRKLNLYTCTKLTALGSGESCQTSRECRCGEFCSNRHCQPATCDISNPAVCQAYPGFNTKYAIREMLYNLLLD